MMVIPETRVGESLVSCAVLLLSLRGVCLLFSFGYCIVGRWLFQVLFLITHVVSSNITWI